MFFGVYTYITSNLIPTSYQTKPKKSHSHLQQSIFPTHPPNHHFPTNPNKLSLPTTTTTPTNPPAPQIMDDFKVDIKFGVSVEEPDLVVIVGQEDNVYDCRDHLFSLEEEYVRGGCF